MPDDQRNLSALLLSPSDWESVADAIESGEDHPLDTAIENMPVIVEAV